MQKSPKVVHRGKEGKNGSQQQSYDGQSFPQASSLKHGHCRELALKRWLKQKIISYMEDTEIFELQKYDAKSDSKVILKYGYSFFFLKLFAIKNISIR